MATMHDSTLPIAPDDERTLLPERIGPYQILGLLGEGGMGRVYLAREDHPPREIALKVMRALSSNARARFAREIKLLAQLEHPGISRLYAAGEDRIGGFTIPWLALERVRGHDLRDHVERTRPDLATRLHLLIAICHAVQHAHEHGVIHRDLKPGNILIDGSGQPRVLDFGVARLGDEDESMTQAGQVMGTMPYMSPEQLSGKGHEVDTRSDVYALGVIAYELVSGRLPHPRLTTSTLFEALEIMRHEEPPRLSTLAPMARGDLEKVVMKALANEPEQRYASAGALADDLQRLVDHRPVLARAPTFAYRSSRFVRRHRSLSIAALVVFLVLATATTVSLLAAQRARTALAEATARSGELAAVNDFVERMLAGADPELGGSPDMPLRDVLEGAGHALDDGIAPPRIAGQLALLLGRTWSALGENQQARNYFDHAQGWIEQGFGTRSHEAMQLRYARIENLVRAREAEPAIEQAQALETELGRINADWAWQLSLHVQGLRAEALEQADQTEAAIALDRALLANPMLARLPDADEVRDGVRHNLAYVLLNHSQFKEAEELLRETLASESARLGPDHPQVLYIRKTLGQSLHRQGRMEEATALYAEVYAKRRERYGDDHPQTLNAGAQLAAAYNTLGRPAEAEPLLRRALEIRSARGEGDSSDAVVDRVMLITTLDKLGRNDEAIALADEVIASDHGTPNRDTLAARNSRAVLLRKSGHISESRIAFAELLRLAPDVIGTASPLWPSFLLNAGEADLEAGDFATARERLTPAVERFLATVGPEHPRSRAAIARLAEAQEGLGLHAEAEATRQHLDPVPEH